jgi:hypothetical protein
MADRIYAPVDSVEAAGGHRLFDRAFADSEGSQLAHGDDPMLPSPELSHFLAVR